MKSVNIKSSLLVIFTIIVAFINLKLTTSKEVETSIKEPEFITVEHNETSIKIPISSIPEINNYLEGASDKEIEVSRMAGTVLKRTETEAYVFFMYGCGTKMCDSVLIHKKGEEISTLKLFFGIFQDYVLSTNENELLLIYGMNEGPKNSNFLIAVDLEEMKIIEGQSKERIINELMEDSNW